MNRHSRLSGDGDPPMHNYVLLHQFTRQRGWRQKAYADVRQKEYADVCRRMLTYADVC